MLIDLKLAIDGTIIMSPNLREAMDSMYDARVPEVWKNISWESTTLGFWFTEFLERYTQFHRWCFQVRNNMPQLFASQLKLFYFVFSPKGKPKVFWMAGFFNPQGFLTAMRQEVTRAHKGWALDAVVLQSVVTRLNKEDITEAPPEGLSSIASCSNTHHLSFYLFFL